MNMAHILAKSYMYGDRKGARTMCRAFVSLKMSARRDTRTGDNQGWRASSEVSEPRENRGAPRRVEPPTKGSAAAAREPSSPCLNDLQAPDHRQSSNRLRFPSVRSVSVVRGMSLSATDHTQARIRNLIGPSLLELNVGPKKPWFGGTQRKTVQYIYDQAPINLPVWVGSAYCAFVEISQRLTRKKHEQISWLGGLQHSLMHLPDLQKYFQDAYFSPVHGLYMDLLYTRIGSYHHIYQGPPSPQQKPRL
jgi:hypothetical protein